jgi:hypothetical protein
MYETYELLWNIRHQDYMNKNKRIVVREGGSTFIAERSWYSIQMMQGFEAITTCQITNISNLVLVGIAILIAVSFLRIEGSIIIRSSSNFSGLILRCLTYSEGFYFQQDVWCTIQISFTNPFLKPCSFPFFSFKDSFVNHEATMRQLASRLLGFVFVASSFSQCKINWRDGACLWWLQV